MSKCREIFEIERIMQARNLVADLVQLRVAGCTGRLQSNLYLEIKLEPRAGNMEHPLPQPTFPLPSTGLENAIGRGLTEVVPE